MVWGLSTRISPLWYKASVVVPFMTGDVKDRKTLLHGTLSQDEHRIRVKVLYRLCLRFVWRHDRLPYNRFFKPQVKKLRDDGQVVLRAITQRDIQHEFRRSMAMRCAEDIEAAVFATKDLLESFTWRDPYIPPKAPGGSKYMRNTPPPLGVVEGTPRDWKDPRGLEIPVPPHEY
jgi:hypothetical protein